MERSGELRFLQSDANSESVNPSPNTNGLLLLLSFSPSFLLLLTKSHTWKLTPPHPRSPSPPPPSRPARCPTSWSRGSSSWLRLWSSIRARWHFDWCVRAARVGACLRCVWVRVPACALSLAARLKRSAFPRCHFNGGARRRGRWLPKWQPIMEQGPVWVMAPSAQSRHSALQRSTEEKVKWRHVTHRGKKCILFFGTFHFFFLNKIISTRTVVNYSRMNYSWYYCVPFFLPFWLFRYSATKIIAAKLCASIRFKEIKSHVTIKNWSFTKKSSSKHFGCLFGSVE